MPISTFDYLASLVTVRDLQTPLGPDVEALDTIGDANGWLLEAASEESYDPMSRMSIVRDEGVVVGTIGMEDMDASLTTIREAMYSLTADRLISADTSLFAAVPLFGERSGLFYVLDVSRITGTLQYSDLFKLPARLCLFSLTLELEGAALELCQEHPRECWETLSETRQGKARDIWNLKRQRDGRAAWRDVNFLPYTDLLACTLFCDKSTMLQKSNLLPGVNRPAFQKLFGKAEMVRNACAHTTSPDELRTLLDANQYQLFVTECQTLIEACRSALRRA